MLVRSMGNHFGASEFKPIAVSSSSDMFAAPSFSLNAMISVDEPGVWGPDAKLRMKVGVLSVTVKQHTEDRL